MGEPHTVANLAALQERDAEIAKLKEEIAALRMQPRGDVVDLVVAADASAAAAASASRGTVLDSAGITEAAAAATASSFHSHFETMFNAFNAANEEDDQLEDEDGVREQEAAVAPASSSARSVAASSASEEDRSESDEEDGREDSEEDGDGDNWFYTDDDDETLLHGPYTVAELQEWATAGHFALSDLVRRGRTGTPVELSSVLDAATT